MRRPSVAEWLPLLPHVALLLHRLRGVPRGVAPAGLITAATPSPRSCNWRPSRAWVATWLCRALVRRLPRLFPQPCLYYCLGGYHFLRRAGMAALLHIGVREENETIASHAWLTMDGEPVFEDATAQGFVEMVAYE